MSLRIGWPRWRGVEGCHFVAVMVVCITFGAAWGVVYASGAVAVSLPEVAESDFVPLGVLVLYRFACAAVALYTLVCIYSDPMDQEFRYLDATVRLYRHRRWTTFTVWCFTLLCGYFMLAAYCSVAVLVGHGTAVPSAMVLATLILFEVSYPMSLLVTAVVTFVLIPMAQRNDYPMERMFRWRPLMMHNGNVLMMQLAMQLAPPPVVLAHLSYPVLFGCGYVLFAWGWFLRTRVYYYYFLDYHRPAAVLAYLGLFATLVMCYGLGWGMALVARQAGSRWWTYPCILLVTLGMTRFRKPAMRRRTRRGTATPPPVCELEGATGEAPGSGAGGHRHKNGL